MTRRRQPDAELGRHLWPSPDKPKPTESVTLTGDAIAAAWGIDLDRACSPIRLRTVPSDHGAALVKF